jgi:hypothetical protein
MASGHGLLAMILLLLDDSTPEVLAVDRRIPESAPTLAASLTEAWPRLKGRVRFVEADLEEVPLQQSDVIVSVHACGGLTDLVIRLALVAGARMAVLPCCHDLAGADLGGLQGWLDGPLAMDAARVARLRGNGYRVVTQLIPGDITPKNRLLLAEPASLMSSNQL